ncbi:oxaloacetate decarboxylase [Roseomonas gilardii]|uniref:Oxaloacetate decarboxylase n=1 Tax=Roseomonas gilardii TaxID=257708 RepID=A0ABU3MIS7_9PROT|nr:oxaloacetate decarboxylase [Roseomonas gilardii]MDT8332914.1 oxaloacetate decarboxylase [Roseomonas gilardii]
MTQRRLYRQLLLERAAHIVPGVYDALSARLAHRAGFRVIGAGGYAAIGSTLGQPDMGQSNMRDMAEHYGRICAAVDAPVTVDADTGFGGVHNVTQAVRSFEAAGAAGIMIGDQTFPNRCGYLPGKSVVPIDEMLAKIRAAVAARRDPDMVIIARTDARSVLGLEEALMRCRLFLDAGADLAKPQTVDRTDEIARAIAEVPCPFMATLSQAAGRARVDIADLRALGVAAVSMPSIGLFAAAQAVGTVLEDLASTQSLAAVEDRLMPLDAYYDLVGLDDVQAAEERFQSEASRLLRPHAIA